LTEIFPEYGATSPRPAAPHAGSSKPGVGKRRKQVERVRVVPNRSEWMDVGFVLVLTMIALIGFRTTYGGTMYLVAGGCGLLLGVLLGYLTTILKQPLVSTAVVTVLAFFLLGGAIALKREAIGGFLPSLQTVRGLGHVGVHGWIELLTTLPPVGSSGPLLAIPYIMGLVGGAAGITIAQRWRTATLPVLPPLFVLIAVILFGTEQAAAIVLQGSVFAVVALAWAAMRSARTREVVQGETRRWNRIIPALGMLAVAGLAGSVVGPHLPGAGGHKRVVLRTYVQPPFDVSAYPSPLAGYRKYVKNGALYDQVLFTVTGDAAKQPVRMAVLDSYDGNVWGAGVVGSEDIPAERSFQRVGTTIKAPVSGNPASGTITIEAGTGVWLPVVGELTSVRFSGPHAQSHADGFRYNLGTASGVVPDGLTQGDEFRFSCVIPRVGEAKTIGFFGGSAVSDDQTAFVRSAAAQWASSGGTDWERLQAIAKHLRDEGKYSDGGGAQAKYLGGHGVGRLSGFLAAPELVGNDEQYAAIFALALNSLNIPARVVLGATPASDGTVKGSNVHAWVEVHLADGSWQMIPTDDFTPDHSKVPSDIPPQQQQQAASRLVPPPNAVRPPITELTPDQPDSKADPHNKNNNKNGSGFQLPAWLITGLSWGGPPVLLVLAICGLIVGIKWRRRQRRRNRGDPATRIANGWRELVDHARDFGVQVLPGHTRREDARIVASGGAQRLARTADGHIFGPGEPQPESATLFWSDVDKARSELSKRQPRMRRIRAALSLTSLRKRRAVAIINPH
jgi:hypothetical protein